MNFERAAELRDLSDSLAKTIKKNRRFSRVLPDLSLAPPALRPCATLTCLGFRTRKLSDLGVCVLASHREERLD